MVRLPYLASLFGIAALFCCPVPSSAQAYGIFAPGLFQTPEVHLGSGTEPSVMRIPPVVFEEPGGPEFAPSPEAFEPEAPMCRPGGFDYLVSPGGELFPGSMADASVSLGEYARELRAHKGEGPPPIQLELHSTPAK